MRTRAPGKVVIAGAYSVLEGSPAIVTAVDRYVEADSERSSDFLTAEVRAAGMAKPYWFDAQRLREDGRKLGLGSSAAILLASMALRELDAHPSLSTHQLRERLFRPALAAHREAQGGGSGIDVAASCYGGTLGFQLGTSAPLRLGTAVPRLTPLALPSEIVVEIWSSTVESSTSGLIARVHAFRASSPGKYRGIIDTQAEASSDAVRACHDASATDFIAAIHAQRDALIHLGEQAGVPIVTHEVRELAEKAAEMGAAVLPAGAGGGDIALYVGLAPSLALDRILGERQHRRLPLAFGAEGVHRVPEEC